MSELFPLLGAMNDGLITSRMLDEAGMSRQAVVRAVSTGTLVRVRRGAYVEQTEWSALWPDGRYRMFVRASAAASAKQLVVSHLSAAVMHRLPTVNEWPKTVHILDPDASGGASSPLFTSHRGNGDVERALSETVLIDGVRVTSLARTLLDVSGSTPMARSVAALDAALHRARVQAEAANAHSGARRDFAEAAANADSAELKMRAALQLELDRARPSRSFSCARASQAIGFANGLADGAGESLSRVRFAELGFAIPELQVRFERLGGRTAFVDFWWRGIRKAGEFDGKLKYMRGAVVRPGQDPGAIVYAEKRREDELRPQMNSMSRWGWDEVLPPRTFLRFLLEHGVPRR